MMYELFGFELADFRELFYVFCLGVLVYRYCTVGHKYPLFGRRKKEVSTAETVESDKAPEKGNATPVFLDVNLTDYYDYRTKEHWSPINRELDKFQQ
ncbi:TPA: hypothetical protein ACS9GO_005253 [Klebsiella pneumoniae]|uniref:hypothetical protein n=1 Tax=Klebsiella pneumoniae TaxID=573 RepID=UPI001B326F5F|nr:hypothetical protein [Klebsiella pneumoniae]WCS70886.1 hypothetical protein OKNDNCAF_00108 [Klebsiella pneumoniae]HCQ8855296.1 hypothetical protein [Klebsiella pneumoniae]HCQ9204228.1 hypothetical protein [Klebsiella pneumoniae]HCQ9209840.1 hypothetical protein [Klebsiella pneumoniae]HCQ9231178.1 hypothetical protein [Klebsiella pneumoniae]